MQSDIVRQYEGDFGKHVDSRTLDCGLIYKAKRISLYM